MQLQRRCYANLEMTMMGGNSSKSITVLRDDSFRGMRVMKEVGASIFLTVVLASVIGEKQQAAMMDVRIDHQKNQTIGRSFFSIRSRGVNPTLAKRSCSPPDNPHRNSTPRAEDHALEKLGSSLDFSFVQNSEKSRLDPIRSYKQEQTLHPR